MIVTLHNHQSRQPFPEETWRCLAERALPRCLAAARGKKTALHELQEIEFNFVDDETIARIHADFLDDPTPTDVITFDHGEVFISLDTAQRQGSENNEPFEREVSRYIIHALLHLAGWNDHEEDERTEMHRIQEEILHECLP